MDMSFLGNALKDPNVIRTMGDVGAALSGPGTIGSAVGTGASNLVRNQQLQKAGEKQGNLMQQFIDSLKQDPTGKTLLGDPADPNTLNSYTVDNKGITIKAPNPGMTKPYEEQKPLESLNKESRVSQVPFP